MVPEYRFHIEEHKFSCQETADQSQPRIPTYNKTSRDQQTYKSELERQFSIMHFGVPHSEFVQYEGLGIPALMTGDT